MTNDIKTLLLLANLFLFCSCEKIIELDIENSDPKIVIEAGIQDNTYAYANLSLSSSFYEPISSNGIEDAIVVLESSKGTTETLQHIENGFYRGSVIIGQPETTYQLTVTSSQGTYTASTTMPQKVKIKVTTVTYEDNPFGEAEEEDEEEYDGYYSGNYHIELTIDDPEDTENYYRLLNKKDDQYFNTYKDLTLSDDLLYNGNEVNLKSRRYFSENEIITVEIRNIDSDTYRYLSALKETQDSGGNPMGGTTPYNPLGNFGPEVLGYFGAWTIDRTTIKVAPTNNQTSLQP